jgi:mevalonate kinase
METLHLLLFHSFPSGKFVLKSDIPVGAGLGSSASYCTVLATAMLITSGVFEPTAIAKSKALSNEGNMARDECLGMISKWAYKAEMIIHGKPSGIDNTVSAFGECYSPMNQYYIIFLCL